MRLSIVHIEIHIVPFSSTIRCMLYIPNTLLLLWSLYQVLILQHLSQHITRLKILPTSTCWIRYIQDSAEPATDSFCLVLRECVSPSDVTPVLVAGDLICVVP